jgi:alpha-D-xyloside xylohydrolase
LPIKQYGRQLDSLEFDLDLFVSRGHYRLEFISGRLEDQVSQQLTFSLRCLLFTAVVMGFGHRATAQSTPGIERQADGIVMPVGNGFLSLTFRAGDVLRVTFSNDKAFAAAKRSIMALPQSGPAPHWNLSEDAGAVTLSTASIQARVDRSSGAITFLDSSGKVIASELPDGRKLEPVEIQGEKTFSIRQQWQSDPDESLYGMGENQLNILNIKNYDLDFWQHNGSVVIPFLVSSKGYGILWDNSSWTRLGDLREFQPIPSQSLFDTSGKSGGLTTGTISPAGLSLNPHQTETIGVVTPVAQPNFTNNAGRAVSEAFPRSPQHPSNTRWEGEVLAPVTGDYQFQAYFNGGLKVWIDNKLVINHWRQVWLPWYDLARVPMEAGHRYAVKIEWDTEQGSQMRLLWKPPPAPGDDAATVAMESKGTSLWSQVGDGIDYYFCYGPTIDHVISGYRQITGQAPIMPLWSFGLWQSRQRYQTAQESLNVVDEFRKRQIPLDIIVQDWQYWPGDARAYGSHEFDPIRFPNPDQWIKSIHDKNARLLISVWGWYNQISSPFSNNFNDMLSKGYLFDKAPKTFIDMFNPDARKLFWSHLNKSLFSKGVDSWWLDGSEPEIFAAGVDGFRNAMNPTAMGSGSRMLNGYPLMENGAVYDGQRSVAPNQRVLLLTRSAFAGQQRYASAVWSGDSTSTWTALEKQIVAGLGFSISGMPYWSMDSGGFAVPARFSSRNRTPAAQTEWDELQTRWFEFATFVPFTRVHGEYPLREMYQYHTDDNPAYQTQLKFDKLRYALLPYVYSLAGDVTNNSGTMMRPLVMDFQNDAQSREVKDQYMFGPAFLVNPVYQYQARSRKVYLPPVSSWYEFWSGAPKSGGTTIDADAPFDSIPLFVRAGSIIPTCPVMQYTGEKPMDPITLHVYTGADGQFTLYEDDGQTYGYEKGQSASIPINWNEAGNKLTIGKRQGAYPGMPAQRTFRILFASAKNARGFAFDSKPDQSVTYAGDPVEVKP